MENSPGPVQEVETKIEEKIIVFLCPVHHRHQYLRVALEQFSKIPGYKKHVFYFTDRITQKVRDETTDFFHNPPQDTFVYIRPMPWGIVDGQRGDFPKAWDWQMRYAATHVSPEFIGIWDDDMIIPFPENIPRALERADLVYGRKLFLWDKFDKFNDKLEHCSVVFFRYIPGDRFHPKEVLQVHAPKGVHDNPNSKKTELTDYVLDYGFYLNSDRRAVFEREKRTGKIDGFTRPLVEEPDLKTLPYVYREKSKEFMARFLE